jgi:hypothetical protein
MAAMLAAGSVARRLTLPLHRRAACIVAALLSIAAVPGVPGWAFAPVALVDVDPQAHLAAGRIPAGGYLLAWQDPAKSGFPLTVRRFTAAGLPLGPAKDLDVGLPRKQMAVSTVAVGDSGAWGVFWSEVDRPDEIGIGGAIFDAQDRLVQRLSTSDPIPDPLTLIISYHPLAVALSGGGFLVASEVGTQDDPAGDPLQPTRTDVYVMKLDAAGRKVGDAVRVNETTQGFQRLTGMGGSKDHVVVSWDSVPGGPETRAVRARFLDGNLKPVGPEVHVAEAGAAGGVGNSRLAVGADGRAVLVWAGTETGAGGGPASLGVRLRAFGPAGEPRGAEHAANPPTPGDHVFSDAALTSEGTVWVSWITPGNLAPAGDVNESVISLRPFDLAAQPMESAEDVAAAPVAAGPFLTGGRGGALVAWREAPSSQILEGFVVGPAGGGSGPPSAPFAIDSLELPDFRVWVRFSPQFRNPSWGTGLEPCLAQALCAAGSLPARTEAIVRVIGPKPNGFLWPQVVRFTTDQVEVWVQQKSTGDFRYYALPAGSPGAETLTGRVDKHGFRP